MPEPRSLDANVLFLCGELSHMLHGVITATFKLNGVGVTVEQFSVLVLLFYQDGVNQQEISLRLNRNKTTITRVISNMERKKMIVRVTDKKDARGKLIFLTAKGRSIQQRAIGLSGGIYLKAMTGATRSELQQGIRLLNRIMRNLK
ncbi:MAG TPA: MarR family winged helix-turn-helix transcriptional regulator [Cyclobacteriaceae bacterium]|nr:MarR family winged helix-turn-helix transcriptional regulator [Cyclobacteriaceae bacterium]